jgi:hypothetical protein
MKALPISFVLASSSSLFVLMEGVNPVRAAVLIGNLPQTNDIFFGTTAINIVRAFSFTLPAGNNYSLDNAILRLGGYDATESLGIQIRDDNGGSNPGSTVLASFTSPVGQGAANFSYTFTPTSPFTFNAGTKYWLYFQPISGTVTWRGSNPPEALTGIATFTNNLVSTNSGATFANVPNNFVGSFQINATEITGLAASTPEPGAIAALSLFGLGLLGVKGRRN